MAVTREEIQAIYDVLHGKIAALDLDPEVMARIDAIFDECDIDDED